MTVWSGMYFGIFRSMVPVAYAVIAWSLRRFGFSSKALPDLAVTGLIASLLLIPVIRPYLAFAKLFGAYPHSADELARFSLPIGALTLTPVWLAFWSKTILATNAPWHFASAFPGALAGLLAIAGATVGRSRAEIESQQRW